MPALMITLDPVTDSEARARKLFGRLGFLPCHECY